MLGKLLDPKSPVHINSQRVLFSIMLLHIIGPQAMMVQPAFVEGLVSQLGFGASDAGFVAAAENSGKAVQSLVMMVLITRVNWRFLFYAALSVLIVGNIACVFVDSYEAFRVIRFFTGAATGTIVPLAYVIIGLTANTERNFGFLMVSLMVYAAVVFFALPSVFAAIGFTGLVVFFAGFSCLGLPFVRNVPTMGEDHKEVDDNAVTLPWSLRGMALAAMFVYFVATFSVWAYMSLIGKDAGISDQAIGNALTLAQFGGIGGAVIVIVLGKRFGRALPLAVAMIGSVVAMFIMGNYRTAIGFTVAAFLFNMLWNTAHPYLLAAQASFDRSGRQVSYAVAMQMTGIAAGPAIAASILTGGSFTQIIVVAAILMVVALILIQPPVLREASMTRKTLEPSKDAENSVQ